MPLLNLYILSQDQNTKEGAYRKALVVAPSYHIARAMHPDGKGGWDKTTWATAPRYVRAKCIGPARHISPKNGSQAVLRAVKNDSEIFVAAAGRRV